ncbi:hypothetical protein B0T18DRAFT_149415 [Schizothecium vesticola]|uniref:Uncharacterized protein n=1 Tax=Schizothecium vesticola TaxID=314040 RepID=A0AA40EVM6_9PEZI|nr:hypothetical protein B0T18DRAFT_149415 [Schizothecium vesticola]
MRRQESTMQPEMTETQLWTPSPSLRDVDMDSMGAPSPPVTSLSPPPASHLVEKYRTKPLPPTPPRPPPRRHSQISSLSRELSTAFETPHTSMELCPDDMDSEDSCGDGDGAGLNRLAALSSPYSSQRPGSKNIKKILYLTGEQAALDCSPSSPSGHNPHRKIKQLTGNDIDPGRSGPPSSPKQPSTEVSPVTRRTSSVYSQDGAIASPSPETPLGTSVSGDRGYESDPDASFFARQYLPRTRGSGLFAPLPRPLDLSRGSRTPLPSTAEEFRESKTSHGPVAATYNQDLYHITTTQLARSARGTPPPRPPRDPTWETRPLLPAPKGVARWRMANSLSPNSKSNNTITSAPTYRAITPQQLNTFLRDGSPNPNEPIIRSTSISTFGTWRRHGRPSNNNNNNQPQPSQTPSPTPSPRSTSLFPATDYNPSTSFFDTSPTRHARRQSILAKVFKRASGAVSPSSPPYHPPASPTTSQSFAVQGGHFRNFTSPTEVTPRPVIPGPDTVLVVPVALAVGEGRPMTPSSSRNLFSLPAAMASMGSLAHRTGDLVGHARTAAGLRTRAEKRRESLMSKIVVVGEGGEVCGKKGVSGGGGGGAGGVSSESSEVGSLAEGKKKDVIGGGVGSRGVLWL